MRAGFKVILVLCLFAEAILLILAIFGIDFPKLLAVPPLAIIGSFIISILFYLLRSARQDGWIRSAEITSAKFRVPYKPVALWVSEIAMLFSLLTGWGGSTRSGQGFFYHKSLRPVVWCIFALSIVEIVVVHLAISIDWIKWTIFAFSVYGIIALFGFYRSLFRNPHQVDDGHVKLKYGNRLVADLSIDSIHGFGRCSPGSGGSVRVMDKDMRIPVLSQVNTWIEMSDPVIVKDLFLGDHAITRLEFFVDDRDAFLRILATG